MDLHLQPSAVCEADGEEEGVVVKLIETETRDSNMHNLDGRTVFK